jgi:hypothetical protein
MEHPHTKIIDELGGNSTVSSIFSISSQAVSKWRKQGIPPARMMYLKIAHPEVCAQAEPERKAA